MPNFSLGPKSEGSSLKQCMGPDFRVQCGQKKSNVQAHTQSNGVAIYILEFVVHICERSSSYVSLVPH